LENIAGMLNCSRKGAMAGVTKVPMRETIQDYLLDKSGIGGAM
jgi:hypothetical protein